MEGTQGDRTLRSPWKLKKQPRDSADKTVSEILPKNEIGRCKVYDTAMQREL